MNVPNHISHVFVVLCLLGIKVSYSQTYENISNLHNTLFASYNPEIRPLNNQSDIMVVNISVILFGLPDVDQVRGSVSYIVQVVAQWYDERMIWDPADYGGINDIIITHKYAWVPPLTIGNPVEFTKIGHPWMQVFFYSDGRAFYTPSDVLEGSCTFYLKYWPFDKQVCEMSIFTFGYYLNKLTLNVPPGPVANTDFYSDNGEWFLDKGATTYEIDNSFGVALVKYKFRLTRRSTFYLLTIILPINAIGGLTCLVFLLPSASGERVSYSITILLAIAVFMTVITEDLPKTSDPVPILCVWILYGIAVSIAGLILVILNLVLYHRDDKIPISPFYRSVVSMWGCKSKRKGQKSNETMVEPMNIVHTIDFKDKRRNVHETPKKMARQDSGDDGDDDVITWQEVSVAMDKLVTVIMLLVAFIPSIVILVYVAAASDYVK